MFATSHISLCLLLRDTGKDVWRLYEHITLTRRRSTREHQAAYYVRDVLMPPLRLFMPFDGYFFSRRLRHAMLLSRHCRLIFSLFTPPRYAYRYIFRRSTRRF